MADIKLTGIDQTTGQRKPVSSSDSVVNNIGGQIEIVVTQVGDYSGNLRNNVQVLFPWNTPTVLGDPASFPGGFTCSDWSPNGEFLAAGFGEEVYIYQRTGTTFTKLTDPASIPVGDTVAVRWSKDGQFLASAHNFVPGIGVWQRDGITFTLLSSPATTAQDSGQDIAWSSNGEFIAFGQITYPFLTIYQRSGTSFTEIFPATLPTARVDAVAWSPNGEFLAAVSVSGSVTFDWYQRDGTTFTKLTNPTTLPNSSTIPKMEWSPNGEFLAINGPQIYQKSGTTLTLLSEPAPQRNGEVRWDTSGKYIAVSGRIWEKDGTTFTLLSDPASLYAGPTGSWSPNREFLISNKTIYQTSGTMPESGVVVVYGEIREGT